MSGTTWALSAANTAAWTVWATSTARPLVAAVEALQTVGALVVVAVVRPRTLWLPVAAAPALLAVAVARPTWSGPVAVAVAVAVRAPQLRQLLGRKAHHGVAPAAWWLSAAANTAWFTWALLSGAPAMAWGAGTALVTSSVVALAARDD